MSENTSARPAPDPTMFIQAVTSLAFIYALSFMLSSDVLLTRPGFSVLRDLGIGRHGWAVIFMLEGIKLIACMRSSSISVRATATFTSGMLWGAYGIAVIVGFHQLDLMGPSGLTCIACGAWCLMATTRWVWM